MSFTSTSASSVFELHVETPALRAAFEALQPHAATPGATRAALVVEAGGLDAVEARTLAYAASGGEGCAVIVCREDDAELFAALARALARRCAPLVRVNAVAAPSTPDAGPARRTVAAALYLMRAKSVTGQTLRVGGAIVSRPSAGDGS